jgi:hypothetical protein
MKYAGTRTPRYVFIYAIFALFEQSAVSEISYGGQREAVQTSIRFQCNLSENVNSGCNFHCRLIWYWLCTRYTFGNLILVWIDPT